MKEKNNFKKEILYNGINIVFDNPHTLFDEKRKLLVNSLILYSNFINRDLRVIFFNSKDGKEIGINAYFKREV